MPDLDYTDLIPEDTTPETIEEEIHESLAAAFPGWQASEAQLDWWIIKGFALGFSQAYQTMNEVAQEIFMYFGSSIMGLPPIEAAPSQVSSTWTLTDTLGHFIPAGTLVTVGSDLTPFLVAADVTVPASEDEATVALVAQTAGTSGDGVTGTATLVSSLAFVSSITLDGVSTGGRDAETIDEYLPRLRELMTLMSPRPILPEHFEVLARQEVGVFRAVAIAGLDPIEDTPDNPLKLTLAVMGPDGDDLPDGDSSTPGTKAYVQARIEAQLMADATIFVINPSRTAIDVTCDLESLPEFNHAQVLAAVDLALTNYLASINWGKREGFGQIPTTWRNTPIVRYTELVALVENVPGVDYINTLTFRKTGGSHGTSNVTLTGYVPLTEPGTFTLS